MIEHLQMATVYVSDLRRAEKFYIDVLGFVKTAEFTDPEGKLPDIVWVTPQPARSAALGTEIGLELARVGDPRIGGPTGLVFSSRDIEGTCEQLASRGAKFTLELVRHAYGEGEGDQEARFVDPDGNEFLLHT